MISYEDRIFNQIYLKESLKKREKLRTNQEIKLADIKRGQKVLDLRCGPGLKTKTIRKKVGDAGEVVCINENKFLIKHAKKICNYSNVKLIQADILDILEVIKKYCGKDMKFNHALFSWIHISPFDLPKLTRDINKLLKREGTFTLSRGGDNFKHPFTKLFNERFQEKLFKIIKTEHPRLSTKSLVKLKHNINIAKIDAINALQEKIRLIENYGFKTRRTREVIRPITYKERLDFYKNPLRNRYLGNFSLKERYRLIKKAFNETIKELGKKNLQTHKYYVTLEKIS